MSYLRAFILSAISLILLASAVLLGALLWIHRGIHGAAVEGARLSLVTPCAGCPAPACAWKGSMLPCDERVIDAVNQALLLARLDPGKIVPNRRAGVPPFCPVIPVAPAGSCSRLRGIRICRRVLLQENPEQCGTVVSFAYRVGLPAAMHLPELELSTEGEVPED